jgi:hypothetical protein
MIIGQVMLLQYHDAIAPIPPMWHNVGHQGDTMSFTIDASNPRTIRAMDIAAGAAYWLRLRDDAGNQIGWGVPSATAPDVYYCTTADLCNCPAARRDHGLCKHSLAVRLVDELARAG